MTTDEERKKESDAWNNWKPGSGQRGWSPYTKPIPAATWRDGAGRPIRSDGSLDVEKFIKEKENDRSS